MRHKTNYVKIQEEASRLKPSKKRSAKDREWNADQNDDFDARKTKKREERQVVDPQEMMDESKK